MRQRAASQLSRSWIERWRRSTPGRSTHAPSAPPGSVTGPPDFVGVGAQKSGTSWWFKTIIEHPEIEAAAKERHFFDSYSGAEFGDEDVARYHRMFPRSQGRLVGEWTPRYMYDFWTPPLLHRAAPEAKLLVILRDPIDRFVSGVAHEAARVLGSVRRQRRPYIRSMIAHDALERSMYSRQIDRLFHRFDRDRILVLQYEHCLHDPAAALQRTFEFLGVDPNQGGLAPPTTRVGRAHPRVELPARLLEDARIALERDARQLHDFLPDLDLGAWPTVARPGEIGGTPVPQAVGA